MTKVCEQMNACQALTLGSIKALGHRRAEDGAVAYAMQAIACGSEIGG